MAGLRPGHPRLSLTKKRKTWMPGTSSAKTRFCPGMTKSDKRSRALVSLTNSVMMPAVGPVVAMPRAVPARAERTVENNAKGGTGFDRLCDRAVEDDRPRRL